MKHMILIAGDRRGTLCQMANDSGIGCHCESTAEAALTALPSLPVRVAVIHQSLKDQDGLWLLRRITENPSLDGVQLVFVGDPNQMDAAVDAAAHGAALCCTSTEDPAKLLAKVETLHATPPATQGRPLSVKSA